MASAVRRMPHANMFDFITRRVLRLFKRSSPPEREIDPDEIFLDATNLPAFDRHQFEGRLEKPISRRIVLALGLVFLSVLVAFLGRSAFLQLAEGERFSALSERNRLRHTVIFGERGSFTDRRGEALAWNVVDPSESEFARRRFSPREGLSSVLGYLKYPSKDSAGFYYKVDFEGMDGVEKFFSEYVAPENGLQIVETDALRRVQSASVLRPPRPGASAALSIDARISEKLYGMIRAVAKERGFTGGAAVLMDVQNGELLALASFPEYDSQILSDGTDRRAIERFVADERKPFLDRATVGLYTPGSIVKPFIGVGALEEGVITPEKKLVSTGAISLPNPFDPTKRTVFRDWKAHGEVDMRKAIADSSDVYFYIIGGGFEGQRGLGIGGIEKYLRLFGFGEEPGGNDFFGAAGVIPNPEWKESHFGGDPWRIGDTYHTAIGQYGLQATPMQVVRAFAALANGGKLLEPRLILDDSEPPMFRVVPVSSRSLSVVREGMRQAVLSGTAAGLNIGAVPVAAKTGTAEIDSAKKFVHSWAAGFFPYEDPRYAFAVVMERGPHENTIGALSVVRELLLWMDAQTPEYLKPELSARFSDSRDASR